MTSADYWYWLCSLYGIGGATADRMLKLYGSVENFFRTKTPPLSGSQLDAFKKSKSDIGRLCEERRMLESSGIIFVTPESPLYPEYFRHISCPPKGFFLKGNMPDPSLPCAAIIGSRRCSAYGLQAASLFASYLAKNGVGIISGMAAGIDSQGQRAALDSGGYSLAVLGCGVDICYPKSSMGLYKRLCADGGIISEFMPGTPPLPRHFPQRNRLISALSDVVIVVEAAKNSGSLITADLALEQGRDVLSIPGRIGDILSEGCNDLIRQGAGIATSPKEALEAVRQVHKTRMPKPPAGAMPHMAKNIENKDVKKKCPKNDRILSCIDLYPTHIDKIAASAGLSVQSLMPVLLELELAGSITRIGSGQFVRTLKDT